MAKSSGSTTSIFGILLIVLGVGLVIWGYRISGTFTSQISQAVTGADTDQVMTFYIGGAVSFFVGLFLFKK